ncbi:MAG: alpha/beta hydrolase [Fusicatenibacter sp.]|nr:alpha/beta hydrolase [Fusicatenibacter sp.]
MKIRVIKEENFADEMAQIVEPFVNERATELFFEREEGCPIHCVRYRAARPKGVIMISHGFTENAEKYKEVIYYFLKEHYHVYLPEHCGHGKSYRLTQDPSLVHVDCYQRYVEDFLYVSRKARKETGTLPMHLYAHSMGGGIGAAAAAKAPELFEKVVLTSPMIRPLTGKVPWPDARRIAACNCITGRSERYVAGQRPYSGPEPFESSSSLSKARYEYYQKKREKEPLYQLSAASYGWLLAAAKLSRGLQKNAWKKITAPVLLFQAEQEHLVSKEAQERFMRKLAFRMPGKAKLVRVPGTKHEIYNTSGKVLQCYWKMVFDYLSCTQDKKPV